MAYTGNSLRAGHVIKYNDEILICISAVHKTPGNLKAFMQGKFRTLQGNQKEYKFSASESLERIDLIIKDMQFLYEDGGSYHFMDTETYDQIELTGELLGESASYLLPETVTQVTFYEDKPLGIKLPTTIAFEVIEADPNISNATATAAYKNAKVETGMNVKVPQFIEPGDRIVINTETGEYVSREK